MARKWTCDNSSMKSINLDDFLDEYHQWKKNIDKMFNENVRLKEDIQHYKKQLKFAEENGKHNLKEITKLSAIVDSLQETIKNITEYEDENKTLKKQLKILSADKDAVAQAYSEAEKILHKQLEELAGKHMFEIERIKTEAEESRKRNNELHKQELKKKSAEIEQMKQMHMQEIRERNGAIARLELEYEGRITKLKEQCTRMNKLSRSSHAPNIQEIFRQKQQYIQKTYESIISGLREEISKLEKEIQFYKSEQPRNRIQQMATVAIQTDSNVSTGSSKINETPHTWYSSLKKSGDTTGINSQKSMKKRKLFQPDRSYL